MISYQFVVEPWVGTKRVKGKLNRVEGPTRLAAVSIFNRAVRFETFTPHKPRGSEFTFGKLQ